jgi:hypothetical protein
MSQETRRQEYAKALTLAMSEIWHLASIAAMGAPLW